MVQILNLHRNGLPPNGADLLERLASGETISEVAVAWGLSQRAVYKTLERVRSKLDARTDCEAIAVWIHDAHQPIASGETEGALDGR